MVVELAALLHDVGAWKFHDGDEKAGSRIAREMLADSLITAMQLDLVCEIVDGVSLTPQLNHSFTRPKKHFLRITARPLTMFMKSCCF
jgi:uncharacterized protein